jgi:hypothetical protein
VTNDFWDFFIALQSGVSTVLEGEPGITKTATVGAFARYTKRTFEVVCPSECEPADISYYPQLGEYEGEPCIKLVKPEWKVRLAKANTPGLVLVDECKDLTPAHQTAVLRLLHEGVPNCWLAGCGNPLDCSTNGFEWAAPVTNRLCVLTAAAPVEEWKQNMLSNFAPRANQFPVLPENWRKYVLKTRGLIVAFLEAQPSLAQRLPKSQGDRGKPWPSLRSWTNAAEVWAAALSVHAEASSQERLIGGCVGTAAARQITEWSQKLDLPPVDTVLEDPSIFDWTGRGDRTYAVLSGVVAHVLNDLNSDNWKKVWNVLTYASRDALAIATALASPLARARKEGMDYPQAAIKRFSPMFAETGAA